MESYEFLKEVVSKNKDIKSLSLREYSYPAKPIGTEPALEDFIQNISRENFLDEKFISDIRNNLKTNRNVGVESKVETSKGYKHILMVDFSLPKSPTNLSLIEKKWKTVIPTKFQKGAIFETDNSYHFIGNNILLSENEYIDFMSWTLLLVENTKTVKNMPIVDVQYVAYCLLKRSACLRISKYPDSEYYPRLVLNV